MTNTYPIYFGCKNIYDYFPKESVSIINIHDYEGSLKVIHSVLSKKNQFDNIEALENAKIIAMDEYGLFNRISKLAHKVCFKVINTTAPVKLLVIPKHIVYRIIYKWIR